MIKLSLPEYQTYLDTRLNILIRRSALCQKVMSTLPPYDYWTYNYAYYLYSLNAESLNHLRYLFGSISTINFYELITCHHMNNYLKNIHCHAIPKDRDSISPLYYPIKISQWCVIILPHYGLPVVIPPEIPSLFIPIFDKLEALIQEEKALAEKFPEI